MNEGSVEFTYPWYIDIASSDPLQQGDFVLKCQIVQPSVEAHEINQTIKATVKEYDVVVMSQSCDLLANKIDLVLLCPFYSLTELGYENAEYKSLGKKEKLRQGHIFGMHLLNKCDVNGNYDFLVVDFKSVYSVPLPFLKQIASARTNRKRLLPPYREHLSQAFARFFMRVGLPVDIPAFK